MDIPEPLYMSSIVALCVYIFTLFYKAYIKVHKKEPDPFIYALVTFVLIHGTHYYLNSKKNVVMSDAFM